MSRLYTLVKPYSVDTIGRHSSLRVRVMVRILISSTWARIAVAVVVASIVYAGASDCVACAAAVV